jgi:hypothetical protein
VIAVGGGRAGGQRADSDPQARVPSVVRVTSPETTGGRGRGYRIPDDGWEPDLADDDSICLRWLRHWSAQLAAFAEAAGGRAVRDERYLLADHGRPASYFNAAVLLAPWSDDAAFGAVVDEIEARTAGGTGAFYLWSIWPTPTCGHAAGSSTGTRRCSSGPRAR